MNDVYGSTRRSHPNNNIPQIKSTKHSRILRFCVLWHTYISTQHQHITKSHPKHLQILRFCDATFHDPTTTNHKYSHPNIQTRILGFCVLWHTTFHGFTPRQQHITNQVTQTFTDSWILNEQYFMAYTYLHVTTHHT